MTCTARAALLLELVLAALAVGTYLVVVQGQVRFSFEDA
jgi:hypothetical protein